MSRKHLVKKIGLSAGVALFGSQAFAALSTEAQAAVTSIGTSGTDMETAVWPVIGAVTAAIILIKLFKRFTSKI